MANAKIFSRTDVDGNGTVITKRAVDLSGTGVGPFIDGADNEPERATYHCVMLGITPAATPTDIFTLQGAAGKVIRLKSVIVSGFATTAGNMLCYIYRRTVANTGGTSAAPANGIQAHDPSDTASALTALLYSANPASLGAGVVLAGQRINLAPAASASIDRALFQYTWQNDKAPILRSASQWFALNLAGGAVPTGGQLDIDIFWTEE